MCTAGMGFFSSDRTVQQYAQKIWHLEPCKLSDFQNTPLHNGKSNQ